MQTKDSEHRLAIGKPFIKQLVLLFVHKELIL